MRLENIIENYESIPFANLRRTQLAKDKELSREVQTILQKINIYKYDIDGEFGPKSKTALQDFIETEGIVQDYILDDIVADALMRINKIGKDTLCDDFGTTKDEFIKATIELCPKLGLPLNEQIAYVIATAEHESAGTFRPVQEAFWLSDHYRKTHFYYYPYHGRGYVQLTHKYNYKKYSDLLNVDFVNNPDKILSRNISLFILVHGSSVGFFSGKRLGEYVNKNEKDYINARKVINGRDKAQHIAKLAEKWLDMLNNREAEITPQTKALDFEMPESIIEQYKRLI
ncbi:MAG: carboxypeptidase [Epsilonproteobacteria bacterium]|nr:carboxypeptidase [Campylobacterota bacterium]